MNEVNLSIVIPHYNSPEKLEILLSSIGDHDDLEVIVVDDNSTNYLEEYSACVKKFKKPGIAFLKNDSGKSNAGAARNVGLKAAKGKWILFSDADDYFISGWYDHVNKFFQQDEYDIIHFIVSERDEKYHQKEVKKAVLRYNLLCEAWLKKINHADSMIRIYWYAPWSKMIRRSLIIDNNIEFDTVRYSNDILFSTKVGILASSICVCDKPIYFHTTTEGSLSTNRSEEAFYIKQISYCKRCDFLFENMDKQELKNVNNNEGLRRLGIAIKRGYGIRNVYKYFKLYMKHHVPVFTLKADEISRLQRALKY